MVLENIEKEYLKRVSVIWSSPLSDYNKVLATNQFVLLVMTYFMWTQVWPIMELHIIDHETRKSWSRMEQNIHLAPLSCSIYPEI